MRKKYCNLNPDLTTSDGMSGKVVERDGLEKATDDRKDTWAGLRAKICSKCSLWMLFSKDDNLPGSC